MNVQYISYCWVAVQVTLECCPRIAGRVDHIVIGAFSHPYCDQTFVIMIPVGRQATKISPNHWNFTGLIFYEVCRHVWNLLPLKAAENGSGISSLPYVGLYWNPLMKSIEIKKQTAYLGPSQAQSRTIWGPVASRVSGFQQFSNLFDSVYSCIFYRYSSIAI